VVCCGLPGDARAVSEEKERKIVSDTEQMKNLPTRVCTETAFVG
jgi:hypothetical protein